MGSHIRRALVAVCIAALVAGAMPLAAFGADQHPQRSGLAAVTPAANVVKDAYEPDDTSATARPLQAVSYHTWHPLAEGGNDADWMYFTVTEAGVPYVFNVFTPARDGSFSDPYIQVYDEAGAALANSTNVFDNSGALAYDDDFLRGSDAGLVFTAPRPGKYFVRVQSDDFGMGQWGEYWFFGYRGIGRRIRGAVPSATAVNVNQLLWNQTSNVEAYFPRSAETAIIIANAKAPADAFAASMLAAVTNSPLLLTDGVDTMSPATKAEFFRLAKTSYTAGMGLARDSGQPYGKLPVVVVGGAATIGSPLSAWMHANPYIGEIRRIGGADRHAVVAAVMRDILRIHMSLRTTGPQEVIGYRPAFVVNGDVPADIAAAAPVAAGTCGLLVTTKRYTLPAVGRSLIASAGVTDIIVVGGPGNVSDRVVRGLEGLVGQGRVTRIAGADRYATARLLVDYQAANADTFNTGGMILVGGADPMDAVGSIPLSMRMGFAPVLFTRPGLLSGPVKSYLLARPRNGTVSWLLGDDVSPAVYSLWNRYGQPWLKK